MGLYDQNKFITNIKKENINLKVINAQALENVAVRVDSAFQGFFRRVKAKQEKAGYPRFKQVGQYDSITWRQNGYKLENNKLNITKIGNIKIKQHRPIKGIIKTLTIKKNKLNQWFTYFVVEFDEIEPTPKTGKSVGIDIGLTTFATLSDETKIENPRFFRKSEKKLKELQSKRDKFKGKQTKKRLTKLHNKIANQRKDFCHKLSKRIVQEYDLICIEDLNINKMLKDHKYAKSIGDAAWNQFIEYLIYKAENAGKKVILVNPAYTSQDCSECGYRVTKAIYERVHNCPNCGLSIDRDLNAALNILRLGTNQGSDTKIFIEKSIN